MRCTTTFVLFLFVGLLQVPAGLAEPSPRAIKLAGTYWCPYTCDYDKHPGFVSEFIRAVFQAEGMELNIEIMPWPTALKKTKQGDYDGLITAVHPEAPHFVFTHTATDIQRSCFYTKKSSSWTFSGVSSLQGQRIGIIAGYGYGSPLDEWIAAKPDRLQLYMSEQQDALIDLLDKLESGEISALIDDRYVVPHVLYRNKRRKTDLRVAGCLAENPFYLAMNPKSPYANKVIRVLDNALQQDRYQKLKHFIKGRYGIDEQ